MTEKRTKEVPREEWGEDVVDSWDVAGVRGEVDADDAVYWEYIDGDRLFHGSSLLSKRVADLAEYRKRIRQIVFALSVSEERGVCGHVIHSTFSDPYGEDRGYCEVCEEIVLEDMGDD